MAETVHNKSVFIPFEQKIFKPTGQQKKRKVLCCFGLEIPLYLGSVQPPYEKETIQRFLTVKDTVLPLGIKTAVFYPTVSETILVSEEGARHQGKEIIQKEIEQEFNAEVLKKVEYTHQVTKDGVKTKCEIFCIENIIFREKLLIF